MIPVLLLVRQGENGIVLHGSPNASAKIPIMIKQTNLRLGSSGNRERIKKKEENHCATSVPTLFNNVHNSHNSSSTP